MARITINPLYGSVSNVIVYNFRGQPCMRSKPARVRQTKATKQSAKVFGEAVRFAKWLRMGLHNFTSHNCDHRARYLIDNAILQWIRAGKPRSSNEPGQVDTWHELATLQLNERIELHDRLRVPLTVEWRDPKTAILHIPAIDLEKDTRAPAHTRMLHWMVSVAGATVNDPMFNHMYDVSFNTPCDGNIIPAQEIPLKCSLVPDSLTVVAVSLKFSVRKGGYLKLRDKPEWTPAAIVAARYEA